VSRFAPDEVGLNIIGTFAASGLTRRGRRLPRRPLSLPIEGPRSPTLERPCQSSIEGSSACLRRDPAPNIQERLCRRTSRYSLLGAVCFQCLCKNQDTRCSAVVMIGSVYTISVASLLGGGAFPCPDVSPSLERLSLGKLTIVEDDFHCVARDTGPREGAAP
jgi:hypothetical protein